LAAAVTRQPVERYAILVGVVTVIMSFVPTK
jgi:hypothetical protein